MKLKVFLLTFLVFVLFMTQTASAASQWKVNIVPNNQIQPSEKVDIWIQGPTGDAAWLSIYVVNSTGNLTGIYRFPAEGSFQMPSIGVLYTNYTFVELGSYAVVLQAAGNNTPVNLYTVNLEVVKDPYADIILVINQKLLDLQWQVQLLNSSVINWRNVLIGVGAIAVLLAFWRKYSFLKRFALGKDLALEKSSTDWVRNQASKYTKDEEADQARERLGG